MLTLYARVFALLRDERAVVALLIAANIAIAGLQFADPWLFGRVIGLLAGAGGTADVAGWLGLWALVGLAGIGASIAVSVQADRLAHRNRMRVFARFYEHILALPPAFHAQAQSGRLMKTMVGGGDSLFGAWLAAFREQLATLVAMGVLLPLTLLLNWRLALALIALVALSGAMTLLVIRRTQTGQRQVEQYYATLAGMAQDALANVVVVQAFGRLPAETRLFRDVARQVIAHQFPVLTWWAVLSVLTRGASTLAVIAIVLVGTLLYRDGRAGLGEIVAFIGFATLLIGRLESAIGFVSRMFQQMPALEQFFAVLDTASSVAEAPDACALAVGAGEVTFQDVSFAYAGGPDVLSDIRFTAAPGSVVALVGRTGAGKTTAMALLQRLWDPTAGRVLIDGQDIRRVRLEGLRRAIGVVFQDSLLFNRSIADNLRIGRPDATEAQLHDACRQADAHDFIMAQPHGYGTLVGERGVTLSGGQRQRLAIARALLKDPPILILDEATSALDTATEAHVARALAALMRGRTTFIVAHRLSTVRHADLVLVFEGGRIVEQGSFVDLLHRDGPFAALVSAQLLSAPVRDAAE